METVAQAAHTAAGAMKIQNKQRLIKTGMGSAISVFYMQYTNFRLQATNMWYNNEENADDACVRRDLTSIPIETTKGYNNEENAVGQIKGKGNRIVKIEKVR